MSKDYYVFATEHSASELEDSLEEARKLAEQWHEMDRDSEDFETEVHIYERIETLKFVECEELTNQYIQDCKDEGTEPLEGMIVKSYVEVHSKQNSIEEMINQYQKTISELEEATKRLLQLKEQMQSE